MSPSKHSQTSNIAELASERDRWYVCYKTPKRAASPVMLLFTLWTVTVLLLLSMLLHLAFHGNSSTVYIIKYSGPKYDLNQTSSSISDDVGSNGHPTTKPSRGHLDQHDVAVAQPQAVDPLQYLPPLEPACHAAWNTKEVTACLPMNCSQAQSCTVADKACWRTTTSKCCVTLMPS